MVQFETLNRMFSVSHRVPRFIVLRTIERCRQRLEYLKASEDDFNVLAVLEGYFLRSTKSHPEEVYIHLQALDSVLDTVDLTKEELLSLISAEFL